MALPILALEHTRNPAEFSARQGPRQMMQALVHVAQVHMQADARFVAHGIPGQPVAAQLGTEHCVKRHPQAEGVHADNADRQLHQRIGIAMGRAQASCGEPVQPDTWAFLQHVFRHKTPLWCGSWTGVGHASSLGKPAMLLHKCCVKRAGPHVKSAPIWRLKRTMAPEPQAQAVPNVVADWMPVNVRHFALSRQSGLAVPDTTAFRHSMGRVPPGLCKSAAPGAEACIT